VRTLLNGVERVRTIMQAVPMRDIVREEMAPGDRVEGPQALAQYVARSTSIHNILSEPAGWGSTTRPSSGRICVCRAIENLWIADASFMPDTVSGNTNAACMMIGINLAKELAARVHS
jgi:choline dehydrogenase